MFCKVNGIELYYEVAGKGDPIILVHGNSESHEIFDRVVPPLSETHTVYTIDSRCHGMSTKTVDISYDLMAGDLIAFINELKIQKPVFYGFSDGGILGLLIAMKEPLLLSKLIISGANLFPYGLNFKTRLSTKLVAMTGNKLFQMMCKEPNIHPKDLRKICVPTVVLAGEKDVVLPNHTALIAEHIKDSLLEIIPNETHGSYIVHSDKLYSVLSRYL